VDLALYDKRVLVTGSSRGIGLAIAHGFLREGARVVLTGRNAADLAQATADLSRDLPSGRLLSHPCDFSKTSDIALLKKFIVTSWQGLDIVIANIGSGKSVPDAISSLDHFNAVFKQNFNIAVDTAREFVPTLTASRGTILFISSIAGMEAFGAPVDYSVAKTAVIAFSKNIARKLARDGVRVNCLAPGNVYFPGGSWDEKIKTDPERIKKLIESTVPMNRFGTPEEIADAALFLCSERAAFITGAVLCIDGGQTVTLY